MPDKDKFMMYMTITIVVAIIVNSFVHKEANLVRDLITVLAYWMPSPITSNSDKQNVYIPPPSKNNSDSEY